MRSPLYLFLLALTVRVLYLYQVGQSPFFLPPPGLDPFLYHRWAQSIAEGKGIEGVFQAMPLYPYFLGFIYRWSVGGLFWAKLIQLLLGAVGVLLLTRIGKELFDPVVGWLAGALLALSGISFFYEALLVPVALNTFLFIVALFLLLRAARGRGLRGWIWAGLFLGLTTFSHAGILLFLPFLFLWIGLSLPLSVLKKGAIMGILSACVMLAMFTIFYRNLRVAGDPVFFTAHGGVNFYIGTHAEATGRFQSLFSRHTSSEQLFRESKAEAERVAGRPLTAGEASRFWFRKGLASIQENPLRATRLLGKKGLLFWNGYEFPDVEDYYFFRSKFSVLRYGGIPFAWIAPWGLLGLLVSFRQMPKRAPLYGLFFSQWGGLLLFFINSRYRAPMVFMVILFAAAGIVWFCRLLPEKRYRTILGASFLLLHFVFLTRLSVGSANQEFEHYNRGIVLSHAGEYEEAIRELEEALFVYPEDSAIFFALGNAHFRMKDDVKARARYEEALLHDPRHADVYFNLGILDIYQGLWDEAVEALEKSAALKPDQPDVYSMLGLVYRKKGLGQKAEEARRRALALGVDPGMLETLEEGLPLR